MTYQPWKQFRLPEKDTHYLMAHRPQGHDVMGYLQVVTLKNKYEDEGEKTLNVYSTHPDAEGSHIGTLQCFQVSQSVDPVRGVSLSFIFTKYYPQGPVKREVTLHYTMEE